ncbi:unnamed protein product [Pseudo-nitzschia multistriata]|uniref:Endonuclease/exonuclease/phosphatase domain-containing protein n=1 Tax=Pseudo-nitzschia multistriata TaxID=183589 RepID=A0A448ZFW4_9STRA|nr:unnamed protein product [Pseudo-nitzschia multistriata]
MTAICASHYRNPLNDVLVGRKHHHQNRFRPRQSTRSAFYKPGLLAKGAEAGTDDRGASVDDREGQSHGNSNGNSNSHDNSNHNNNHRSHLGREGDWNFRPSALQHDDYGTGAMGVDELVDLYVRDNERAAMEGVVVPPRPRSKSLRWFLERERRACSNNSNRNSNNSNHNHSNNKDEDSQHRHTKAASVRDALFSASSSATAASSPPKQPQHQNQQQYQQQQQNQHQRPRSFAQLRCLQWNIQAFTSPRDERNLQTITAGTIRSICETDSDVLVLNEIHWRDTEEQLQQQQQQQHQQQEEERKAEFDFIHSSQSLLEEVLRLRGYSFVRVAVHGDTPTMVATRKKVLRYEEVVLSGNRSALCILVECHGIDHSECIGNGHFHSSGSGPSPSRCWVVGTHLDAFDGIQRAEEIQTLLSARLGERDCERTRHLPVLVMGDFNQQRSGDYTGPEWNRIAGSAGLRKVPLDDGVAGLLEGKGFRCVLDAVRAGSGEGEAVRCNWDPHQPPPSTHWSGTTIDYTYYRCPAGNSGGNSDDDSDAEGSEPEGRTTVHPHGVYVGPAGFSDHRMTVTDWTLATTKPTGRGKMQQHPHQPQQRPPRYMDKDFFFRHLPAGRHDSWRCAAAAPDRTPEGEPLRGRPPPAFPACEKGSSSRSIGSTASSSSSSSCPSIGSESLHELFRPLCSE